VSIFIYDLLGRTVATLIDNKTSDPGSYEIEWDGKDYASGVYLCKFVSEKYTNVKKMVLLK
jgi:hypothetical protein